MPRNPNRYIPRARTIDPWTSQHAAVPFNEVMETRSISSGSHHHRVLAAYEFAIDGLAAFEAAEESGYKEAWKRLSELGRLQLIKNTGVPRRDPETNRKSLVWIITPLGIRALRRLDAGKTWSASPRA